MDFFCSNCGIKLRRVRKAIPKFGTILDLIEPHTCLEVAVDPSTVIIEAPIAPADQNKFVESLNGLKPTLNQGKIVTHSEAAKRSFSMTSTDDLRDRRFDDKELKSTAPSSVLDQIKQMSGSIPAHDLKEDADDSEMGG